VSIGSKRSFSNISAIRRITVLLNNILYSSINNIYYIRVASFTEVNFRLIRVESYQERTPLIYRRTIEYSASYVLIAALRFRD